MRLGPLTLLSEIPFPTFGSNHGQTPSSTKHPQMKWTSTCASILKAAIYRIVMDKTRWGAISQGIEVSIPMIQITFPPFGTKSVHPSVNLPTFEEHMVNDLKVRQNRPQGSNFAFKVRLRADDQLPNELVFEYT
jgi:hypothetical protein